MKYILIVSIIMLSFVVHSQEHVYFDHENKEVYIQNIVHAPGKTEKELMSIVHSFFVGTYKHGTKAIEFIDHDAGKIVSRGSFRSVGMLHQFVLTIQIKDERIRYTVNGINSDFAGMITVYDKEKMIKPNKKIFNGIRETLEEGLNAAISKTIDDDW